MHLITDSHDIHLFEIMPADALFLRKNCGLIGAMVGGVAGKQK